MKITRAQIGLVLISLTIVPSLSSFLHAQSTTASKATEKTSSTELPTVEEILASSVNALGGKEKLSSIKSIVTKGTLSIPAAGIKGEVSMKQTSTGKFLMNVDMPGVANSQSGSDGETIWESSSVTGPEILKGIRADQTKLQMTLFPNLDMGLYFETIECTGKEKFADEECYVVVFGKKDAKPMTIYYSVKSGLEKGNQLTASTAMGEWGLTSVIKSYLEKDGIKFAKEVEVSLPNGMKQILAIEKVDINVEIDANLFDLPKEVADLIKK